MADDEDEVEDVEGDILTIVGFTIVEAALLALTLTLSDEVSLFLDMVAMVILAVPATLFNVSSFDDSTLPHAANVEPLSGA